MHTPSNYTNSTTTMKRISLLTCRSFIAKAGRTTLVFATVFTMGYARAAEPPATGPLAPNASMERALDKQLSKHLSYPLLRDNDMTGEVYVSFVVNKEGKVEVISATSSNDELCTYVLRKLALVDIGENPAGTWKIEHVLFTFGAEGGI